MVLQKTTAYAEQLLEDLKQLEVGWPDRVIAMQRNWIGKSTVAKVLFGIATDGAQPGMAVPQEKIEIFTTRIDTIYGASAIVLAPNHPLVGGTACFASGRSRDRPEGRPLQCGGTSAEVGGAEDFIGEDGGYCYRGEGWVFYGPVCGEPIRWGENSHLGSELRVAGIRNRGDYGGAGA